MKTAACVDAVHRHVFRPQTEHASAPRGGEQYRPCGAGNHGALRTIVEIEEIHRRAADEACREQASGPIIEIGGPAVLLDAATAHQDDTVSHAHGFGLVMGHIDHRDPQTLLQGADLAAQLLPKLGIQIGERLVEQANRRLGDQSPAERDALLLAAGKLRGLAPQQRLQSEQRCDTPEPARYLLSGDAANRKAEGDVVGDRQMRKQRVGLKHHGDAARGAGLAANIAPLDLDHAGGGLIEPGDHSQHGRLAAAGRPEQNDEFALLDGKGNVIDCPRGAPCPGHGANIDADHDPPTSASAPVMLDRNAL